MRDGKIYATVEPMELRDVKGDHFTLGAPERVDLSTMDVVCCAKIRPSTWPISRRRICWSGSIRGRSSSNDPAWVRNSPEKIFVTEFAT